MKWPHLRFATVLLAILVVLFAALAIAPVDRTTWMLENALSVALVGLLIGTRNLFPLSRLSYASIFVFLCLHTVGAHFEYSNVPYEAWARRLLGGAVEEGSGPQRNHYDRFVHFCYGLLLTYPMRELFLRVAGARGFWGCFLPIQMTLSMSLVYELIEWSAAMAFGGDLGVAYVGTQGDEWDAQKDMALAGAGAMITMTVVVAGNLWLERDFAREWAESLRIKRAAPLGEERIREAISERRQRR